MRTQTRPAGLDQKSFSQTRNRRAGFTRETLVFAGAGLRRSEVSGRDRVELFSQSVGERGGGETTAQFELGGEVDQLGF